MNATTVIEEMPVTIGGVARRLRVHTAGIPRYFGDRLLELRWSAEAEREFEDRSPMLITTCLSLLWLSLRGQAVGGQPVTEDWVLDNAPTWRLFSDAALVFRAREAWGAAVSDAMRHALRMRLVHDQEGLDTEVDNLMHFMEETA